MTLTLEQLNEMLLKNSLHLAACLASKGKPQERWYYVHGAYVHVQMSRIPVKGVRVMAKKKPAKKKKTYGK